MQSVFRIFQDILYTKKITVNDNVMDSFKFIG